MAKLTPDMALRALRIQQVVQRDLRAACWTRLDGTEKVRRVRELRLDCDVQLIGP